MGEINKWPQGMVEINNISTKEGELKYNINIEINISSLSRGEKSKAFSLPCEKNKNDQAKTPAPPHIQWWTPYLDERIPRGLG